MTKTARTLIIPIVANVPVMVSNCCRNSVSSIVKEILSDHIHKASRNGYEIYSE